MIKRSRQAVGYGGSSIISQCIIDRQVDVQHINEQDIKETLALNLRDFRVLVKENVHRGLHIYKTNGEIVPLATHPFNQYDWKREQRHIFQSIGKWMDQENTRILLEPRNEVRLGQEDDQSAISDLAYYKYYVELLDLMGLNQTNKVLMTIGQYDDQVEGRERFVRNFYRLSTNVQKRMVLTNPIGTEDPLETIKVAMEIGIPFILSIDASQGFSEIDQMVHRYRNVLEDTWKYEDGNPIVQIKMADCDPCDETYKMPKFHEFEKLGNDLIDGNLSIILDGPFRDVAAIKLNHYIMQHRGVFLKETCVAQWRRYRYLVMAHDPEAYMDLVAYMEHPKSYEAFYSRIETSLKKFKKLPNDLFAAEEVLDEMSPKLRKSEYDKAYLMLKERSLESFKSYCRNLIKENNIESLMDNYYFFLS